MRPKFLFPLLGGIILLGTTLVFYRFLLPPPSPSSALPEPAFAEFKKLKLQEEHKKLSLTSSTQKIFTWDKKIKGLIEQNPPWSSEKDVEASTIFDLNNNSLPETYSLKNGQLIITESSTTLWQSPETWWVDNFFIADSTGDGALQLNLSVWKEGNFGEHLPFWITNNDPAIKNHFFVLRLQKDGVYPLWQSSNLERPNCEFSFTNLDDDPTLELVVIEGEYEKNFECSGKYLAVWKWSEWGFFNEWRSAPGHLRNLRVKKTAQKTSLIIDEF